MAERTHCPIPYPSNRKIAVKLNMASGKRKIVSKTLYVGSWIDKAETLLSKKSSGEIGSTKQIFKTITDNLVVQIKKVQSMISSLLGRVDARDCWMKLCRLRQSTGRYENAWNPGQEEIAERRRVMLVKYRPTRPLLRTNPQDTNMQSREQNVLPCYALPQPKIG